MTELERALSDFRTWAWANGFELTASGEWQTDYPDWDNLYKETRLALEGARDTLLPLLSRRLLLEVLAHDNESETILDLLPSFQTVAVQLIEAAPTEGWSSARWQSAVLAGRLGRPDLLTPFLTDPDPYVRQRAAAVQSKPQ